MKRITAIHRHDPLLSTWKTSNRVTEFLIENLPSDLWDEKLQGSPRRTIRMVAGHIHNARCMWIKMIGAHYAIKAPASVERRRVGRAALLRALHRSSKGIIGVLQAGLDDDGALRMQGTWSNIPADVVHFMPYMLAHEAHHRGQIVLAARALGHRLPPDVTNGLWQWKSRHREATAR